MAGPHGSALVNDKEPKSASLQQTALLGLKRRAAKCAEDGRASVVLYLQLKQTFLLFNPIANNSGKLISREGGSQKGLKQFNREGKSEREREK